MSISYIILGHTPFFIQVYKFARGLSQFTCFIIFGFFAMSLPCFSLLHVLETFIAYVESTQLPILLWVRTIVPCINLIISEKDFFDISHFCLLLMFKLQSSNLRVRVSELLISRVHCFLLPMRLPCYSLWWNLLWLKWLRMRRLFQVWMKLFGLCPAIHSFIQSFIVNVVQRRLLIVSYFYINNDCRVCNMN